VAVDLDARRRRLARGAPGPQGGQDTGGGWAGVLLRGGSGAGKSDLALRLIHDTGTEEWRLVADDYVDVVIDRDSGPTRLFATPPEPTKALLEVRGLGIDTFPFQTRVPLKMAVDLQPWKTLDRLPEREYSQLVEDVPDSVVPLLRCDPFEPSAVIKIALALDSVMEDQSR